LLISRPCLGVSLPLIGFELPLQGVNDPASNLGSPQIPVTSALHASILHYPTACLHPDHAFRWSKICMAHEHKKKRKFWCLVNSNFFVSCMIRGILHKHKHDGSQQAPNRFLPTDINGLIQQQIYTSNRIRETSKDNFPLRSLYSLFWPCTDVSAI
jgi:hypothetical protein